MRGAGLRLNVDVRRHWKCPACGAERRQPATVTTVQCNCSGRPQMRLVEGQRRDRGIVPPPDPVLEFDLSADPVTIPENLPVPDPNQRFGRGGPRPRRSGLPGPGGAPDQGPPPRSEQAPQDAPAQGASAEAGLAEGSATPAAGAPSEQQRRQQGNGGPGGNSGRQGGRRDEGRRGNGGRDQGRREEGPRGNGGGGGGNRTEQQGDRSRRPPKGDQRPPGGNSRPPRTPEGAPQGAPPQDGPGAASEAPSASPPPSSPPPAPPQRSAPEDFGAGLEGPAAS